MKYISIAAWRDLTDGHAYSEGDSFPFDGREISPERISVLMSRHNRAGFALIKAVDDENDKMVDRAPEPPKRAAKGRKKAQ